MVNIDDKTRRMLVQNSDLSRERIENSRKSRIDAIMDICSKPDIVWGGVVDRTCRDQRVMNYSQRRPCEPIGLQFLAPMRPKLSTLNANWPSR